MDNLKPYPAYQVTAIPWLGQVPAHWNVVPGRACYHEKKIPNKGMKENTVLSLSYGKLVVKPPEKLHGLVPESFETYQIVDPGDIICRPTDLQNDWNSLRFGISSHRGIITSAYMNLNTTSAMTKEFGHLLLHAYDLKKIFYGLGSGLRQNLDWRDFKYLPCVLPSPEEQTAIARYLDWADSRIRRLIRARQKQIKLLEEHKQAVIHQAVTGQIDVRTGQPYRAYKDSGVEWFEKIPAHWNVAKLGAVCKSILDGPHVSPNYVDSGVMFISARNVKTDKWSLEDAKYISNEDYELFCKRLKPEKGDVLYTKGGTTGVARVVDFDEPFQVWVHVAVLKLKKEFVNSYFLAYILNSPRVYEQSQLQTRGATNQDLVLSRMSRIQLLLPTIDEQVSISDWLTTQTKSIELSKVKYHHQIEFLREYRTRLIADVVTGKVDVRQAVDSLPDIETESELPEDWEEETELDEDEEMLEEGEDAE